MATPTVTQHGTPADLKAFQWSIKEILVGYCNFTVTSSSDGTTYNSSGDQLTNAAAFGNNWSWYAATNGTITISVQRGSSNWVGRVKFTHAAAGFDAGSPSATQVPATATATAEIIAQGGGTDAAPTTTALQGSLSGQGDLTSVYDPDTGAFAVFGTTNTGGDVGVCSTLVYYDPCTLLATGDTEGSVFYWMGANGVDGAANDTRLSEDSATIGPVSSLSGTAVRMPASSHARVTTTVVPANLARNPFTSKVELFPVHYMRRSTLAAPTGRKGASSLFSWVGSAETDGTRYSAGGGTANWLNLGDIAIRWDGSSPQNDQSSGAIVDAEYISLIVPGAVEPAPGPLDPTPGGAPQRIRRQYVRVRR